LSATGINIPQIYNNVYNSFTEGRARLFGYTINRKMRIMNKGTVAYMSLKEEEMRRFWFQQGDSEGFVNYPLTIKKMRMSAIFIEHHDFIRVSLRSRQCGCQPLCGPLLRGWRTQERRRRKVVCLDGGDHPALY
jgi:phosphoesterase RecJ-like protein